MLLNLVKCVRRTSRMMVERNSVVIEMVVDCE